MAGSGWRVRIATSPSPVGVAPGAAIEGGVRIVVCRRGNRAMLFPKSGEFLFCHCEPGNPEASHVAGVGTRARLSRGEGKGMLCLSRHEGKKSVGRAAKNPGGNVAAASPATQAGPESQKKKIVKPDSTGRGAKEVKK